MERYLLILFLMGTDKYPKKLLGIIMLVLLQGVV
jgi:hypothetical protein